VSNQIDLSNTESATISYARWYSNSTGAAPNADVFEVFVSDNDGADYVLVETVGPSGAGTSGGWIETGFNVADFVALSSAVRVKFVASDLGDGSVVEAAIDDVRVLGVSCTTDTCPADLNGDTVADFFDISALLMGQLDYNGDTAFDFFDISTFLQDLSVGCP
jgi:hypothetical protein